MSHKPDIVIYWDSSAVLSVLFQDDHSKKAGKWIKCQGIHLISSLVNAEVYSVVYRLKKENILEDVLSEAAIKAFETGPWRQVYIHPDRAILKLTLSKYYLRGADLWHFCSVAHLQDQLPEIKLLTFDQRLKKAAASAGFSL